MLTAEKPLKLRHAQELLLAQITVSPKVPKNFTLTYDIAIIGGGPAGAYLGYCLAKQGIEAIILDHSHPRQKPCGGSIPKSLQQQFPLIERFCSIEKKSSNFRLISPSGFEIQYNNAPSMEAFTTVSRRQFDQFILNSAVRLGCKLIPEKAISISKEQQLWKIKTSNREITARLLVGADGCGSIVRKTVLGPYQRQDLALSTGYLTTGNLTSEISQLKYYKNKDRYLWLNTHKEHCTIGITDTVSQARGLQNDLDEFVMTHGKGLTPLKKWSAFIPKASSTEFFKQPCAGRNWMLIGDAAGHVHPLTGAGIQYALWSAELASQAIISSDLRLYEELWRKEYGKDLSAAINSKNLLYKPDTLDKIVSFAKKSQVFSGITSELFIRNEKLSNMGKKLLLLAPKILYEATFA